MALSNMDQLNNRENREQFYPGEVLEQVLLDFISRFGGKSLGDLDTPSFMRRVCNVTLRSPASRDGGFLC